jgi:hypothetical protein
MPAIVATAGQGGGAGTASSTTTDSAYRSPQPAFDADMAAKAAGPFYPVMRPSLRGHAKSKLPPLSSNVGCGTRAQS